MSPPRWDKAEAQMAEGLRLFELGEARLFAARLRMYWGPSVAIEAIRMPVSIFKKPLPSGQPAIFRGNWRGGTNSLRSYRHRQDRAVLRLPRPSRQLERHDCGQVDPEAVRFTCGPAFRAKAGGASRLLPAWVVRQGRLDRPLTHTDGHAPGKQQRIPGSRGDTGRTSNNYFGHFITLRVPA
jgi:hypothetical protein